MAAAFPSAARTRHARLTVEVLADRIAPSVTPTAGTFENRANQLAATSPNIVVVRDLNLDGTDDLVVANLPSVSIRLGLGNGTFDSTAEIPVTHTVTGVTVGQFTGDIRPDIAVGYSNGSLINRVAIFRNDGNGTFSAGPDFDLGTAGNAISMASADLTGDGREDLVFLLSAGSSRVRVYRQNANGTFTLAASVADVGVSVAAGDLDGDGDKDLAVGGGSQVRFWRNNGASSFTAFGSSVTTGAGLRQVLLADLDRDAKLDLITANHDVNNVTVAWNDGNGIFPTTLDVAVGASPISVAVGDIDNDGDPDVLTTNQGSISAAQSVSLRVNNGNRTFSGSTNLAIPSIPYMIAAGKFDQDNRADIAVAHGSINAVSNGQFVNILLAGPAGDYSGVMDHPVTGDEVPTGASPSAILVGKLNTDNRDDLIVGVGRAVQLWLAQPDGRYTTSTTLTGFPLEVVTLARGDFNNDNILDLAAICNNGGSTWHLSVRLGTGNGSLGGTLNQEFRNTALRGLAIADMNNDGRDDIVFLAQPGGAAVVWVWLGDGQGTFPTTYSASVDNGALGLAVAKLDTDQYNDVVVAVAGASVKLQFLMNQGTGNPGLSGSQVVPVYSSIPHLSPADFNGDGVTDLAFAADGANGSNSSVNILLGGTTGPGNYSVIAGGSAPVARYPSYLHNPSPVLVRDVNGDGHLDVVSAGHVSDFISVRYGTGTGQLRGGTEVRVGGGPNGLAVTDVNADGLLDLLAVNNKSNNVSIRRGIAPNVTANDATAGINAAGFTVPLTAAVTLADRPMPVGEVTFSVYQGSNLIGNPVTATRSTNGTFSATYELPGWVTIGTYSIVAEYAGQGANADTGVLRITPATSTVGLTSNGPTTYGEDVVLTAVVTSAADPTGATVVFREGTRELGRDTVARQDDGQYRAMIVVTGLSAERLDAGNHVFHAEVLATTDMIGSTSASKTHTVNTAPLTVTADAKTKVYGAGMPALTYQVVGLLPGDTLTGELATNARADSPVGSYPITVGTLSGGPNYEDPRYTGADLTVTQAPLYVTANPLIKAVGALVPTLTYRVEGLLFGDQLTGELATTARADSPVGLYPITLGTLSGGPNYDIPPHFIESNVTVLAAGMSLTLARAGDSVQLVDAVQGQVVQSQPLADTAPFVIQGNDTDADQFTIVFTAGFATVPAGSSFNAGGGPGDSLAVTYDGNLTLTPTQLSAVDFVLEHGGIDQASLTGGPSGNHLDARAFLGPVTLVGNGGDDTLRGGAGDDVLTGGPGNDKLFGNGGTDTLVEAGNTSMVLTNSTFTGTGLGRDEVVDVERARLTGGAGRDTLNASKFTRGPVVLAGGPDNDTLYGGNKNDTLIGGPGADTLNGGPGSDLVQEVGSGNFVLGTTLVIGGVTDKLLGIERAALTGDAGNNVFTVSGWPQTATLDGGGGTDRVVSSYNGNFTLTDTSLLRTGGRLITLASIEVAQLAGGTGNNAFTVTGWTGQASLDGGLGADTVISSNDADFTLTTNQLIRSTGGTFNLGRIERARLIGGAGNNTLDASGFAGSVVLVGNDGDDVLKGGSRRDLLIGGRGADDLQGNGDDDILVAGWTNYDANTTANMTALDKIMAEWTRPGVRYNTRRLNLHNGGGGIGPSNRLRPGTVHGDASLDALTGGDGEDWFLALTAEVINKKASEVLTPIA